jgi:hypothetical protein
MAETQPEQMEPLPDSGKPLEASETVEVQADDYDSMTVEELEQQFAEGKGIIQEGTPDEPEPEPIAAESETSEPQETEQGVEDPPTETPESPVEPELDENELRLQEMQIQLEQAKAAAERFEFIAGNNAGKMGHLQKQLLEATERRDAPVEDPIDYAPDRIAEAQPVQPQPRASNKLEAEVAELRAEQMQRATEQIYNEFLAQVASDLTRQGVEQDMVEPEQNAIMEQITPTLRQRFEPFGDIGNMGPKSVNKVTRMVLQSAYSDIKLAKIAELRKQASERKATQIAESKIVKQAASPSGSSGQAVKEPPPKRIEDMTAEEADAEMIRLYGDGGNLRP